MTSSLPSNSFWRDKQVLVTGHTGFKGSWLVLWLCELGAKVAGMGFQPASSPNLFDQLRWKSSCRHTTSLTFGILRSTEKNRPNRPARSSDSFGGATLVRQSYIDPLDTWSTNVQGTLNVLKAVKTPAETVRRGDSDNRQGVRQPSGTMDIENAIASADMIPTAQAKPLVS